MARTNKRFAVVAVCTLLAVAAVTIVFFSSRTVRMAIYRLPIGGTFDKYTRLSKLVHLGMSPVEVQAVLGRPESVHTFTNGLRWQYDEVAPTTGWEYVAEFQESDGSLKLTYLRNVEHVVFPTSRRWELGKQLETPQFPLRN